MIKPKIIVFASGSNTDGGSGFQTLVENLDTGVLRAEIVAVVSNHLNGGVRRRADELGIKFIYFPGPFEAGQYEKIVKPYHPCFVALSGWLKLVKGIGLYSVISPQRTINIHPALLPESAGTHGHSAHEMMIQMFKDGEITESAVSMHFVTKEYDEGPVFFHYPVEIKETDTAEDLAKRANEIEHEWQPRITELVVSRQITWDGKNPNSLIVPSGYEFLRQPSPEL